MKRGQIVNIYTLGFHSKVELECQAKLIKRSLGNAGLVRGYEWWEVEFTDQPGKYFERVVKVRGDENGRNSY